jgi:glycosyltransferase involved in cell wall biosynthesis
MKVALIHDHLAQMGGAEKVLQIFHEMFPNAPIYTLMKNEENVKKNFPNAKIETSIIQKLPWGITHYRWYMPFMPMAVEFYDLTDFDLVLSSTSSFAKGAITTSDTLHVCYCHTPTRYLWSDTHQYIKELSYNKYFKKIISLVLNYIRMWDRLAADRVDSFIANSKTVKKRIKKYYKAESEIIYPNIEEEKFHISNKVGDYYLAGCRLVPYKRIDIIVKAFKELNLKLKIFGDGVDMERLKEMAGDSKDIEFLGRVSDNERSELFSKCKAYINPQTEDFGITIVEAMASGRPVIAVRRGGATETIIEGETGEFFEFESSEAIVGAVKNFETQNKNWDSEEIRKHALKFSTNRFKTEMTDFIDKKYKEFNT